MIARIKRSDIWRLSAFLGSRRGRYWLLLILSSAASSANFLLNAFAMGAVVNAVEAQNMTALYRVVALLGIGMLLRIADNLLAMRASLIVDEMVAGIRADTFVKVQVLPMQYYDTHLSGDLISRVTNDIATFTILFREHVPRIVFFVTLGIFSIATSLAVNWWLGLLLCVMSMAFKLLNDRLVKAVKRYSEASYSKNATLVQLLTNILSGQTVIKMFGLQVRMQGDYEVENREYTRLSQRLAFHKGLQNACNALMTSVVSNAALVVGAYLVFGGSISLATLLIVNQLAWLVTMMFRWTGQILGEASSTAVAGRRIADLLDAPEEPAAFALPAAPDAPYAVAFERVTFAYEDTPVLRDVSFTVAQGKRLALVGESGGGKSTVVKLLLGFYDAQDGNIWVAGKSLSHFARDGLRAMTAYVSQESILFDNTILENIRYGKPGATDEEVYRAAKMAYAHDFILQQPDGYQTIVGERAIKLSGGQRQRIAIARAILKDAPILLLDEATSALDAESQEKVQLALNSLMAGRTTIVVAHRLSTIETADEILVFAGGAVAERGTHQQLLAQGGRYDSLYHMQFRQHNQSNP